MRPPAARLSATLLIAFLMSGIFPEPAAAQVLHSVEAGSAVLRTIDPATAQTTAIVGMTLAGFSINSSVGLATHPGTGQIFVLFQLGGPVGRSLATVIPATGVATLVGHTGVFGANLAFDCAANLYTVTGQQGAEQEAFFRLSTTTGAATFLSRLGRGDDGEALGFNPLNSMLYHASGHSGAFDPANNDGVSFERFDPLRPPFVNIPLSGAMLANEIQSIAFNPANGTFFWKEGTVVPGPLFSVTVAGVATLLGNMDHLAKGLAVSGGTLFSVSPRDSMLRTINQTTAATMSSLAITMAGQTVNTAHGLAVNPTNGTVFVMLQLMGVAGRSLATLTTTTGVATLVGNTGDQFATIGFDGAGNLFGVTGFGNISQALFRLSTTTGAPTYLYPVDRFNTGYALGLNNTTGRVHFVSGSGAADKRFVSFAQADLPVDIPIAATALINEEAQALGWENSSGMFLWKQDHGTGPLFRVNPTTGAAVMVGALDMDHQAKGLAFTGAASTGCSADASVTKTGTPGTVTVGTNVSYTVTVNNAGPAAASSVSLTDPIPVGMNFVSLASPMGWTCMTPAVGANGTVTCTIATLASGVAAQVFTLVVSTATAGARTNTAMLANTTPDPNAANNMASAMTTVNAPVVPALDFSISAMPTLINVVGGQTGMVTITITPLGGSFTSAIGLSCNAVPPVTCMLPLTSVTPGATPVTFDVSFPTQAGALPPPIGRWPAGPLPLWWLVLLMTAIAAGWLAASMRGPREQRLRLAVSIALLLIVAGMALAQTACTSLPTPARGPYTVTITGTSGSLVRSAVVTVNVQ